MPRTRAESAAPRKTSRRKAGPDDVRLTGDRVVVQVPEDGERRSRSGLLIPATAAVAPKRCVWADVVLVGPDVRQVKSGDRILFLPQAGLEVEMDGHEYLLLRERDVQAISSNAGADGKDIRPGQYL
jgi:chaperonin GroES